MRRPRWRDLAVVGVLALLPLAALAPAWTAGRLLAPGDGLALHFPLRTAVWRAYRAGELASWNPGIFSGIPLLPSYRAGAFHPLTVATTPLGDFAAFQVLVIASLSLAGALLYFHVRHGGGTRAGAFTAGLLFALGPHLVSRLSDTATITVAPLLVLLLIALAWHRAGPGPLTRAVLAVAVALVAGGGSPEAAVAGAAIVLLDVLSGMRRPSRASASAMGAAAIGLLLAAPQLWPTLIAAFEAGSGGSGLADPAAGLSGPVEWLVRYVSHTPALAFALAALPLLASRGPLRAPLIALAASALLLFAGGIAGRGFALVFDLSLAVVAGRVVSEYETTRGTAAGDRTIAYVLVGGLASLLALAAVCVLTGPLPTSLALPVGLLALSFVVLVAARRAAHPGLALLFLLPLSLALALQPRGRVDLGSLPTEADLRRGTPTREALDRAMATRPDERVLALVREWPRARVLDLAYAGLSAAAGRRSANGYDPLAPDLRLRAFDGMDAGGALPSSLFRTDAGRLELFGVRFVQVLTGDLTVPADGNGLGDALDLVVDPARPRAFPLPITAATEVRLATALADSVLLPQGTPIGLVTVHLASGREISLLLRAGHDTAEWAFDRPDVKPLMKHEKPPVVAEFTPKGESFRGHHYLGVLPLPGRFLVDGVRIASFAGQGRLLVFRVGLKDKTRERAVGVSATAGYVSDTLRFREAVRTPFVHLLELRGGLGRGRVLDGLRLLPDEEALMAVLRDPLRHGLDPRREAVASAKDAAGLHLPEASKASRAVLVAESPSRLEFLAEGPGLLVTTEGWDGGWRARVDDHSVPVFRVNATHMGLTLGAGTHRVVFAHRARGLFLGTGLAAAGLILLLVRWPPPR